MAFGAKKHDFRCISPPAGLQDAPRCRALHLRAQSLAEAKLSWVVNPSRALATRAPSASAESLTQTTEGATALLTKAKVAKPHSAPAITRSRPTMSA